MLPRVSSALGGRGVHERGRAGAEGAFEPGLDDGVAVGGVAVAAGGGHVEQERWGCRRW